MHEPPLHPTEDDVVDRREIGRERSRVGQRSTRPSPTQEAAMAMRTLPSKKATRAEPAKHAGGAREDELRLVHYIVIAM